jgi:formamidopyrimidine-DNA glycosylase
MPELPEVETIVRGLREKLTGREFSRSEIRMAKCLRGDPGEFCRRLRGRKILGFARRGKNIVFHLSGGVALIVHLRMTGQLHLVSAKTEPGLHTHALFCFRNHPDRLRFNDPRKFGRIWFEKEGPGGELPSLSRLGPEPLEISAPEFVRRIRAKKRLIKPLLLDQNFLAGVGNIYADESLHRARIHPRRNSAELSGQEIRRLYRALKRILQAAILAGGTSVRSYVDAAGSKGGYQNFLRVYQREGEACRNCGGTLLRELVGNRSTFFCPRCQPTQPRKMATGK